MQVTIKGRHTEVPAKVRTYMEEKSAKLPKYYDQVMAADIIIDEQGPKKKVEMVINVSGHEDLIAQETGDDLFACFDICMDRAEKQLTKYKEKARDRKHTA
jgi:putative sigma-54 modulation protein